MLRDRRWLCGHLVNMRFDNGHSLILGVRWDPCPLNVETINVFDRFINQHNPG